jgi:hypothetical protein
MTSIIDIREINIFMDTNIPGKEIVILKKSILYNPVLNDTSSWNELPYFTYDIEYPESYLSRLTYEKQMEFFFKKTEMTSVLNRFAKPLLEEVASKNIQGELSKTNRIMRGGYDSKKTEYRSKTSEKNVMVMLRLMFPTKYPILGNVFSSFHSVITGENEIKMNFMDFLPSFLKTKLFEGMPDYSYLKIDGKTYTVTQVIWENDIYNHKEYKKLIKQFDELQRWKQRQLVKLTSDLEKKRLQFKRQFQNEFQQDDIQQLIDAKKDNPERNTHITAYNEALRTLLKNLDTFMTILKTTQTNTKYITDSANIFVTSFLDLIGESRSSYYNYSEYFHPKNRDKLKRVVDVMKPRINDIKTDEYILENYLKKDGVNMDYKTDKQYKQVLESKYPIYTQFIQHIQTIRSPILESTNDHLQNSIDDFANNTEKYKGIFNFLLNPINIKKNPFSIILPRIEDVNDAENARKESQQYQNLMNTGVSIRPNARNNRPYFEIYVQMNLIGGEMNDDNKSKIDCLYQGETLGDKLSRVLHSAIYHPWNINSTRVFFDMEKGKAIPDPKKQTPEEKESASLDRIMMNEASSYTIDPFNPKNYFGGKQKTKNHRQNFIMRLTKRKYL